jgi:cell division protein FtsI (penicillin-binding protein 3)
MMEEREEKAPRLNLRFFIFIMTFALAALAVLGRYAYLAFSPGAAETQSSPGLAERGAIIDRNGRILALQTRLGDVSVWRPDIVDREALCVTLAPILHMDAAEMEERINSSASDFIYLKRQADQSTIDALEKVISAGLRGVKVETVMGRIYPEKTLASPIIGFVGADNIGLGGIEYSMESFLEGSVQDEVITNGNDVQLTLDVNVQHILEEISTNIMAETQAEAVMFLAMDPRNGEILGAASLPGFDPNDIRSSTEIQRMDRPAIWAYEPGSVFKIFSLAGLLDAGVINNQTIFYCNGHYERTTNLGERVVINCLAAHGPVTLRDIIVYSCNAGAAYASDTMAESDFSAMLRKFGFGSRTNLGLPGETAGFLTSPMYWSARTKPTIAMGQEISVSALQMMQAATAIANDGLLVQPRIIRSTVSPEGISQAWEAAAARQIIKPETARSIRADMVEVTSNIGTGWRANVSDLSLAVKTGTAQIIDPLTNAYSSTDFIASCMAMLPAEDPSLVLYLTIIKPKGEYLGGRIAAPPIREAAEQLIDYLGIPRGRNPQVSHSGTVSVPRAGTVEIGDLMPNLIAYSKRELLPLLDRDDITVQIIGDGWVVRQSPAAGTPITPGTLITLELQ